MTENTIRLFGDTERYSPVDFDANKELFEKHPSILERLVEGGFGVPGLISGLYRMASKHHEDPNNAFPVIQYLGPNVDSFDHDHIQWRLSTRLMKASHAFYVSGTQAKTSIDSLYQEPLKLLKFHTALDQAMEAETWTAGTR